MSKDQLRNIALVLLMLLYRDATTIVLNGDKTLLLVDRDLDGVCLLVSLDVVSSIYEDLIYNIML